MRKERDSVGCSKAIPYLLRNPTKEQHLDPYPKLMHFGIFCLFTRFGIYRPRHKVTLLLTVHQIQKTMLYNAVSDSQFSDSQLNDFQVNDSQVSEFPSCRRSILLGVKWTNILRKGVTRPPHNEVVDAIAPPMVKIFPTYNNERLEHSELEDYGYLK
uniref:Uncharacterized protein n=1 Tax=Romanomermis culicivorax TaxID=13658 RepID=A0A915KAN0_ROMCU